MKTFIAKETVFGMHYHTVAAKGRHHVESCNTLKYKVTQPKRRHQIVSSASLVRFVQRLSATIAYTCLMGLSNLFAASPFKSNWLTPTCPWELRYRCRGSYGAEMIVLWLYAISLKKQRLKLASFSTKSPDKILTGRCCM